MTTTPITPIPGPTLLGAVAKLLSAGHSPEETLTGVADLLYRGLPAQEVAVWLREPTATEYRAIVSPPSDRNPGRRTSSALQALLDDRLGERAAGIAATVHRFQGNEKLAMVLDLTDSLGTRLG